MDILLIFNFLIPDNDQVGGLLLQQAVELCRLHRYKPNRYIVQSLAELVCGVFGRIIKTKPPLSG